MNKSHTLSSNYFNTKIVNYTNECHVMIKWLIFAMSPTLNTKYGNQLDSKSSEGLFIKSFLYGIPSYTNFLLYFD